ncbi:FecR family protein [Pararcticibacter amylolyticus]|uniref:FecR family protein n=1 Tax=Pararcticibacter amylolyticus TaxID=2173175 RepID=UPI001304A3F5|nr:FecR family protein [Pararcticibacter amylolyticus]
MKREEFKELTEKYISGFISEEEKHRLFLQYDELQKNELHWDEDTLGPQEAVRVRLLNKVLHNIRESTRVNRSDKWKWLYAAAILLIILSTTLILFKNYLFETEHHKLTKNEVFPGTNKAVLTLSNGSKIVLDSSKRGNIIKFTQTTVVQPSPGLLTFRQNNNRTGDTTPEINTLSTPRGAGYQLVLADGTKVWLNAESSISFPSAFNDSQRIVSTTGEVYFEVAEMFKKNGSKVSDREKVPFLVKTRGQLVEVLGTHFNINAYPENQAVKTVLAEGSVRVTENTSRLSEVLKPGQESSVKPGNPLITVRNISADNVIAWKNGLFVFDETDIAEILTQVQRLYDVNIKYQGKIPPINYTGNIPRSSSLSKVLLMLEKTGSVRFRVEDHTVIVSK